VKTVKPLAVFACLPPTDSAIGKYTQASFQSSPRPLHFFVARATADQWVACKELVTKNPAHRLFHSNTFKEAFSLHGYEDALFVIGNSLHHDDVLRSLFRYSKSFSLRKHLHIHEAQLTQAMLPAFSEHPGVLLRFLNQYYPEKEHLLTTYEAIFSNEVYGIRMLSALTEPTTIITDSSFCSKIVEQELAALVDPPRVANVFLPLTLTSEIRHSVPGPVLRIGSFGIPHHLKHIDILVQACRILADEGKKIELTLAGPGVTGFLNRNQLNAPFIKAIDNPDDELMYREMQSTEVGVQLRWPSHGESSACVNELLSFQRKVIITDTGSFSDLGEYAMHTPVGVSPKQLAARIASAREFRPDFAAYRQRFSTEGFQKRLFEIIDSRQP
jgi:glycosyltransferase involved in cell wall biosynthesis